MNQTTTTDAATTLREQLEVAINYVEDGGGDTAPMYAALAAAERAAIQPAGEAHRRATDAEVAEWAERHGLERAMSSLTSQRAAFEDAESMHMTYAAPIPQEAKAGRVEAPTRDGAVNKGLNYYKVFFHGEFVGTAPALTEDEAVVWFANRNHQYNQNGLMAVQSN